MYHLAPAGACVVHMFTLLQPRRRRLQVILTDGLFVFFLGVFQQLFVLRLLRVELAVFLKQQLPVSVPTTRNSCYQQKISMTRNNLRVI